MPYETFKDLRVWQESKTLSVEIYKLTQNGKLARDFGLRDQMQRASVSVASNIAEGYERGGRNEFPRFLTIARGSLAELRTQMEIAHEIGVLEPANFERLDDSCQKIGAMITNLVKARKTHDRESD